MRKWLRHYIDECLRSRVGWIVALLHGAWFCLAIANMSPPEPEFGEFLDQGGGSSATLLAGRPFHFTYESLLLKLLILGDVPAIIAILPLSALLVISLEMLKIGSYWGSYGEAALSLFGASCQW